MDKFYIITNGEKDPGMEVTRQVASYLEQHGCSCGVQQVSAKRREGSFHYTDPELIPEQVQCIIVLGGDGTLLQAARDVVDRKIPLFGINMGTLGYLAEVGRQGIRPALDKLIRDDYKVEERMMLKGTVYHEGRARGRGIALNDIVISREGPLRVICLRNYVNGEYLNEYNADGMIISTPTGSTGYSLSAGGPIVSPGAALTVITPLAPHALNSRIIIEKAQVSTRIIKMSDLSFVEVLRRKMSK